jgi:hypothetical protein
MRVWLIGPSKHKYFSGEKQPIGFLCKYGAKYCEKQSQFPNVRRRSSSMSVVFCSIQTTLQTNYFFISIKTSSPIAVLGKQQDEFINKVGAAVLPRNHTSPYASWKNHSADVGVVEDRELLGDLCKTAPRKVPRDHPDRHSTDQQEEQSFSHVTKNELPDTKQYGIDKHDACEPIYQQTAVPGVALNLRQRFCNSFPSPAARMNASVEIL